MIGIEGEFRAVGREIVLQGSAELERRRIEVAGRQVAHGAAWKHRPRRTWVRLPSFHSRPMAIEQRIGHVGVERALAPALLDLLVASIVGAAFRIDVARKRDPFAVRGPERVGNSGGNIA